MSIKTFCDRDGTEILPGQGARVTVDKTIGVTQSRVASLDLCNKCMLELTAWLDVKPAPKVKP